MTSKASRSFQSVAVVSCFCIAVVVCFEVFCEMACVSRDEISDHSFESTEEQSSEASEDSFHSTTDDFLPYDENLEPMANEEEAAAYVEQVAREEEEEEILWSRFSGEDGVESWSVLLFVLFLSLIEGNPHHVPFI